jgi:phosphoribosylformylglycinamidine synthase
VRQACSRRYDAQFRFALYLPHVHIRVEESDTPFTCAATKGQILKIPIAHSDGNYNVDDATLAELEKNRQVLFHYTTRKEPTTLPVIQTAPCTTSPASAIANATSPASCHIPSALVESALDSADGLVLFHSMVESLVGAARATA